MLERIDLIVVDGDELYPIPNYPEYYANLDEGKIFSVRSERYLVANPNKRFGYCYVTLRDKDGNSSPMGVHSAVLSAYLGYERDAWVAKGLSIHHLDNDKTNNSAMNLQLVRHKDQFKCPITRAKLGKGRRLTEDEIVEIRNEWMLTDMSFSEFCNYWSDEIGCSYSTIENLLKNRTYRNLTVEFVGVEE